MTPTDGSRSSARAHATIALAFHRGFGALAARLLTHARKLKRQTDQRSVGRYIELEIAAIIIHREDPVACMDGELIVEAVTDRRHALVRQVGRRPKAADINVAV